MSVGKGLEALNQISKRMDLFSSNSTMVTPDYYLNFSIPPQNKY